MHAAIVEDFGRPPRYRKTVLPVANDGEVVVQVRAAALSNLVFRLRENGLSWREVKAIIDAERKNDAVNTGARITFSRPTSPARSDPCASRR